MKASLLTTFNSHWGQLRFLQMPFGAKMSQDVFSATDGLPFSSSVPGVIGIHDDMVIFGVDQEDHDANLINLLNVLPEGGIGTETARKLETSKERGVHILRGRVQRTRHASGPQEGPRDHRDDSTHGQATASVFSRYGQLHGDIHSKTSHITLSHCGAMLKKDNVFHWEDQQTRSFQQVKTLIGKANTTPLRYYDRDLPVTVQADASLRGLGACLIQKHEGKEQPIAFASKSLTDVETRYANIERELLAIVFACQRFSTYLFWKELRSRERTTNH